jgi:hypothetical protein
LKAAAKETTVDGIISIVREAFGLAAAGAVLAFVLSRRRRRTMTSLALWTPLAAPARASKPETTRQVS